MNQRPLLLKYVQHLVGLLHFLSGPSSSWSQVTSIQQETKLEAFFLQLIP
uniref:Uncharacterized protein n=1 Tax=Lepeophtheirus salmonis TaxID=72036 RepID=A0A0K2VJ41_LEPSM